MSTARRLLAIVFLLCASAWSEVFVHWTQSNLPAAKDLGFRQLVLSWNGGFSPVLALARRQGYRVYVEAQPGELSDASDAAAKSGAEGIIVPSPQSGRAKLEESLAKLRVAHRNLKFLVLSVDGKQPQMRGGTVVKRGSVLEVSSPTAQPWIDTNLCLLRIEQRADPRQIPLYTFSWPQSDASQQPPELTPADYALAVAEAGAFHANLLLEVEERLQKALTAHDQEAWKLWKEVQSYADFYSSRSADGMESAANVAVVVDDFDPGDEVMNLLARHNIPFKVQTSADLKSENSAAFDLIILFAKPDPEASRRLVELASRGKTAIVVDAHGAYPWEKSDALRLNDHAVSYVVEKGRVIELADTVTDPETFAQDVRRLLGKENSLLSLWNGLTTIAVAYHEQGGPAKSIEFVNYAEEPLRVQVQIKGSFTSVRYETPENKCCASLALELHDGFTEFVIPDLRIAGRVLLGSLGSRPAP